MTSTAGFTPADKEELNSMEKLMPLWKIAAYRSFTINSIKRRVESKKNPKSQDNPERDSFNTMIAKVNSLWFRKWFSTEANANELERQFLDKIATIESAPS
jgi:hypothetical protein